MILVTAANGNQGRLLVPKLLAAGRPCGPACSPSTPPSCCAAGRDRRGRRRPQ